jgi:hypothetical protein
MNCQNLFFFQKCMSLFAIRIFFVKLCFMSAVHMLQHFWNCFQHFSLYHLCFRADNFFKQVCWYSSEIEEIIEKHPSLPLLQCTKYYLPSLQHMFEMLQFNFLLCISSTFSCVCCLHFLVYACFIPKFALQLHKFLNLACLGIFFKCIFVKNSRVFMGLKHRKNVID